MEEFEIKFLEVDVPDLEKKLLEIGAEKVGEYNYLRTSFDYPDWRMNKDDAWVRLRTDGAQTTLTYKKTIKAKGDIDDDRVTEIEVTVGDYDKTYEIMKAMGFIIKREEKNRRIRYMKEGVSFDIDFWPNIPTYVEIEARSLEEARQAASLLGFDPKEGLICSPKKVYEKYGINKDDYSYIGFDKMIKR